MLPISLKDVQEAFAPVKGNPHGLDEFYHAHPNRYVGNVLVPQAGTISLFDFVGIVPDSYYAFSSHVFTPCGGTGPAPAPPAAFSAAYAATPTGAAWANDPFLFDVSMDGVQRWVVPETGRYRIDAAGAEGGDAHGFTGRAGRIVRCEVDLARGEWLLMAVGHAGGDDASSAGGGGGSFVFRNAVSKGSYLIVAGGGAGVSVSSVGTTDGTSGNDKAEGLGGGAGDDPASLPGAGGAAGSSGASGSPSGGTGGSGLQDVAASAGSFAGTGSGNGGFGGGGGGGSFAGGGGGGFSGGGGGGGGITARGGGGGGGGSSASVGPMVVVGVNYGPGYVRVEKI